MCKLMPKTFFIEGHEVLYVPNLEPVVESNNDRVISCVCTCPQFMNYPTAFWGLRVIPNNAKCPYVKYDKSPAKCSGGFVCVNGKEYGRPHPHYKELFVERLYVYRMANKLINFKLSDEHKRSK